MRKFLGAPVHGQHFPSGGDEVRVQYSLRLSAVRQTQDRGRTRLRSPLRTQKLPQHTSSWTVHPISEGRWVGRNSSTTATGPSMYVSAVICAYGIFILGVFPWSLWLCVTTTASGPSRGLEHRLVPRHFGFRAEGAFSAPPSPCRGHPSAGHSWQCLVSSL